MRRITHASTMALALMLASAAAQADPDATVPSKISEKIIGELAELDLEGVSADAVKYMGEHKPDIDLKNSFALQSKTSAPRNTPTSSISATTARHQKTTSTRLTSRRPTPTCGSCGKSITVTGS